MIESLPQLNLPFYDQKIKDDQRLSKLVLIEAGIMGVSIVPNAEGANHAIFVDAIKAPTTPGTVSVIDAENVQELIGITSAHDVGLEQVMVMIKTLSPKTKLSIIGIVVEKTFPIYSPAVANIVRLTIAKIRRAKLFYLRGLSGKKARITSKIA